MKEPASEGSNLMLQPLLSGSRATGNEKGLVGDVHSPCIHRAGQRKRQCFPPVGVWRQPSRGYLKAPYSIIRPDSTHPRTLLGRGGRKRRSRVTSTASPQIAIGLPSPTPPCPSRRDCTGQGITRKGAWALHF